MQSSSLAEKDALLSKLKQMRQGIHQIYQDSKSDDSFESDITVIHKIIRYNRKKTNYHLFYGGGGCEHDETDGDGSAVAPTESMIAIECIYNCFQNLNERIQKIEDIYAAAEAAIAEEQQENDSTFPDI